MRSRQDYKRVACHIVGRPRYIYLHYKFTTVSHMIRKLPVSWVLQGDVLYLLGNVVPNHGRLYKMLDSISPNVCSTDLGFRGTQRNCICSFTEVKHRRNHIAGKMCHILAFHGHNSGTFVEIMRGSKVTLTYCVLYCYMQYMVVGDIFDFRY